MERNDIEAVQEVLPEPVCLYFIPQIFVCCGDDPNVRFHVFVSANATIFSRLQKSEEFRLHEEADFRDLIEKERSGIRDLDKTLLGCNRIGEGAFLVPKELALDQSLRYGRTIESDERLVLAKAVLVKKRCYQFFSGSTRAFDDNAGIRGSDFCSDLKHFEDGFARTDNIAEHSMASELRLENFVLDH